MNAEAFVRGFLDELIKIGQMASPAVPTGENVMGATLGRLPRTPTPPPSTAARTPRPSIMPAAGAM